MAVIENGVTLMWSNRKFGVATSDNKKFTLTVSQAYQVVVELGTLAAEIFLHPEIPKIGRLFPGSNTVRCRAVNPTQISPLFWIVDVQYSGEVGANVFEDEEGAVQSPLDAKPIIRRRAIPSQEQIDQDYDGNPIVTANNEPIQGITKTIYDLQYTITKNYPTVSDELILTYLDATNEDEWFGFAPGRAHLEGYSAEERNEEYEGGETFDYFQVTWDVIVRTPYNTTAAKAWHARTRHEGFYVKSTNANNVTQIKRAQDEAGNEVTTPVLLKQDGTKETNPENAYWLEFPRYGSLPYNTLIGPLE